MDQLGKEVLGSLSRFFRDHKPLVLEVQEPISRQVKDIAPALKEKKEKVKTGTKEWSEASVNIQTGCENNCSYCYAKRINQRFDGVRIPDWSKPTIRQKDVAKLYHYRTPKLVMFPTSHDITINNVNECRLVLYKLLKNKNKVVIVSKPVLPCIKALCSDFVEFKDQILFRFTIGSTDNQVLKHYEPGAPCFEERLESLKYAHSQGFRTSVSCEPMLDQNISAVVDAVRPYVTQSIWLGLIDPKGCCGKDQIMKQIASQNYIDSLHRLYRSDSLIYWKDRLATALGIEPSADKW